LKPFDLIPIEFQKTLQILEERDQRERRENLKRSLRLRQIPRETGEFLFQFLLIHVPRYSKDFTGIEIGTSGGYSALWQSLALFNIGYGQLISIDNDPVKYKQASENLNRSPIKEHVKLIQADAKEYLKNYNGKEIQYMFLDAEKEDYCTYYAILKDQMQLSSGAILIADNIISHEDELADFISIIQSDDKVSSIIISVGKGLAVVRWR
jgi:predicted O-methyltransferase YrrM